MSKPYPLIVRHDIDGFFGLAIDNLVQLLLIIQLAGLCGLHQGEGQELLYGRIFPGAAVSIILGNLFYAWQAHRLARKTGRSDVTALPYGINTPSLIVYIFFVIKPTFDTTGDARIAWGAGLIACLGSGLIELVGAFVAERIRRITPRAALLSTLAGIAIGFISMTFALQIWQNPIVALLPLAIILVTYFSHVRLPFSLPGGLLALVAGTIIAWVMPSSIVARPLELSAVSDAWAQGQWCWPAWAGGDIIRCIDYFTHPEHRHMLAGFVSVIIPMGLFNVLGSLQNIESAQAAGDEYPTAPSLAVNGAGSIVAALFGSCFPTTIYIGHPGWKGLGARAGYSTLNGIFVTLICITGTVGVINSMVPIEAGIAIVLWIGVVITAQAFSATPSKHAPAVALGLFPAIAGWGATVMAGAFIVANGTTMQQLLTDDGLGASVNGFLVHGMNLLERGYIFTGMILAAISAQLIDRRFFSAAVWSLVAAALAAIGLIHAYQLNGNTVDYLLVFTQPKPDAMAFHALDIALGYVLFGAAFAAIGWYRHIMEHES